jgi:hypothetical protein
MMAGEFAGVDPEAWQIIEGKLYLSYNRKGIAAFTQDADTNITAADRQWTRMAMTP